MLLLDTTDHLPPVQPRRVKRRRSDGGTMCNVLHGLRVELDHDFLHGTRERSGGTAIHQPSAELMYTAADQDMVPLAELLAQYGETDALSYQDPKSGSGVVSKCLACNQVPVAELLMNYTADISLRNQKFPTVGLHEACTLPRSAPWIEVMCANGAKVNERNLGGQTPLHIVLLGDVRKCRKNMEESILLLLQFGADVNAQDHKGDTPLLYLRTFLKEGAFEEAACLAQIFLERSADVNLANKEGCTLLMYSVSHLDDSIGLTRLLLNYGASVWNDYCRDAVFSSCVESTRSSSSSSSSSSPGGGGNNSSFGMEHSAFSWFLKAIINRRRLENCSETVRLLALVMGDAPRRMHAHVLRTMFRHVRCFRVLGPVFLQLKMSMMRYWNEPHGLKYLCWRTIRRSLGPKRVNNSGVAELGLPRPLQNYVLME